MAGSLSFSPSDLHDTFFAALRGNEGAIRMMNLISDQNKEETTQMSEHSKGDWFNNKRHVGTVTDGNGVLHIATAVDCTEGCFIATEEAEANARLIAAAPDLLKACESVLRMISSHQVYDKDARGVLTRAVAKAKGEL